jgi:hypothetical protein
MKTTLLFLCFAMSLNGLSAQTQHRNEWNLLTGAGMTTFTPTYTFLTGGVGGRLGFGYTHFFTTGFGFSFGTEAVLHHSAFRANALSVSYPILTPPGLKGDFLLQADYSNLQEKHTLLFLQLPLMLNIQLPLGGRAFFYLGGGGKYAFPVSLSYKQTASFVQTTGYSYYTGQTYQNLPHHGFSTASNHAASGTFDVNPSLLLALEAGFKWKISSKSYLYTGFYLDTSLRPFPTNAAQPLLVYHSESPYIYNSILETDSSINPLSSVKHFAAGISLKLAFGSGQEHGRAPKSGTPPPQKPKSLLD